MKFELIKDISKEERQEIFDNSLSDLRELMDMVADLYEKENVLVSYFKDENGQYQSSFKDYNMESPFKKGGPFVFVPLYANNKEDRPMCITHDSFEDNLKFILECVLEHIKRRENGEAPLPKVRIGDKNKVDDELILDKD